MRIIALLVILAVCSQSHAQTWQQLAQEEGMTFDSLNSIIENQFENKNDEPSLRKYKHYKRWATFMEDRVADDGSLENYAKRNQLAYTRIKDQQPEHPDQRSRYGHWATVSPSEFSPDPPHNGRINAIAFHPTNSDIIYVGAVLGGLWKSSNGGTTWTCLTDGLPTIAISDILIHPDYPGTIFILTGDADGRYVPSVGVLVSYDGGVNWRQTDLAFDMADKVYGYNLAMDPNDPNTMLAATTNGIYRTTNGWYDSSIEQSGDFRDIEFKPGNSDTAYATSANSAWRSVNGGDSWDNLNNNGLGLPTTIAYQRVGLGLTPANPEVVYFIYTNDDADGFEGLYLSDDDGASFTLQSTSPNITGPWAWWDLDISVNTFNPAIVYVSGIAVWKSIDWGETWTQIANGEGLPSVHADVHRLVHDGGVVYSGSDGGISKSTTGGNSWTNLTDGLNIMQFYDICIDGTRLMGGTQDNGSLLWNIGDTEADHILWGDGFECMFHPSNTNIIYGSTQNNRYRSTDGGNEWEVITPPGEEGQWTAPWIMHHTNSDTMYASFHSIFRTFDAGTNWSDMYPPDNADGSGFRGMVQSPSNPDIIYAMRNDQVIKTSNANAANPTWTDITTNLPVGWVSLKGITIDNDNPNKVWVSFTGYNSNNKVFVTYNGGSQWFNYTGSLPNVPVHALLFDPAGAGDAIYAGTDIGVFFRNGGIGDWVYYSNGLPVTMVQDLHIVGNYLYAGTFGRGIWRSNLYDTCPVAWNLTPANDPSNPFSTGPQTYEASSSIVSTRIINGGIGTDVTYQAGSYIRLNPGFHVKTYNEFEAKIGGCTED